MATLRKDGRWQAVVTVSNGDGKYKRKFFYSTSDTDAEAKANNYYNKYIVGSYEAITFSDYSSKYLEYRKSELAIRTYDYYKDTLRLHIRPVIGNMLIGDIKPIDIKKVISTMEYKGIGAKTRLNAYLVMHLVLKEAMLDEIIESNPVANVRKPKYVKKEKKIIPPKDFWEIYDIADEKMKIILYLAWCTGMRVGEIVGLQHNDMDTIMVKDKKISIINVKRSISKSSDGLVIKMPKSSYGKRKIPIPVKLANMLNEFKKTSVFLFTNIYNEMQDPSTISKQFTKLCKKLGFNYSFHQLRHTHATMLADAGISPKAIQQRLGHHSAIFSLDVYTHSTDNTQNGIDELGIFDAK